MINWIEHWFSDGASYITHRVLTWIHVALHAIAGIITGITGNVTRSWDDLQHAIWLVFDEVNYGARVTYHAIWWLVNRGIPYVYRYIISHVKLLESDLAKAISRLLADIVSAIDLAEKYAREFVAWFHANVVVPLANSLGEAWHWINSEGNYVWQLITHPDRLADLILAYFAGAIMRASDKVATAIGAALWDILTKNLHRVLRVAEDIISAVM